MFLVLAASLAIVVLVLAVPAAYRRFWPITIKRPKPFLVLTFTLGLAVAAVAVFWVFDAFVGVGIAGGPSGSATSVDFALVLRNRLLVAAALSVIVQYLLCRITHTVLG